METRKGLFHRELEAGIGRDGQLEIVNVKPNDFRGRSGFISDPDGITSPRKFALRVPKGPGCANLGA